MLQLIFIAVLCLLRTGKEGCSMEPMIEFSLAATRWLQENYPQLASFMLLLGRLGRFEFYLLLAPLIYWCIDKQNGKYLTYLLAVSSLINVFLKHLLHGPRPYWLESSLGMGEEASYGIPSWHSQTAMVAYLFIAYWLRRGWVWLLCLLMILLMGLSRIYLGLHSLSDVIVGYLIGLLIFAGFLLWQRYFHAQFQNRILGQRLLAVIVLPIILTAMYLVLRRIVGAPDVSASWSDRIDLAELTSIEDIATSVGTLTGLGIGFVLEASRVYFLVSGSISKRVLRYLLGIAVAVAIWRGLGLFFPADPLWLAVPLRILRYLLVGLWVSYYAPVLFVRLKLADASSGPDVGLTVTGGGIMRG